MAKKDIKNDTYKRAREGRSKFLTVFCQKCLSPICSYQKDGTGNLRRMYIDRMSESKVSITEKSLKCPNGHILGAKIIYKKENRPAFRLITGAFSKRTIKS